MKNLESLGKHCLFLMMLLCLFPLGIQAQNYVKGTILDENGEPVIGATIKVQGSNEGVVSDLDGHFSLNVKPGSRLAVSYVGYKTQLLKASNNMKIVLSTDSKFIDEVVVVGYGVQKKSDLTGSVGTVNEKDLANRSTSDAGAALQGKVSGVQVLNFSGAPGDAASIRVRGYSSNSGNLGPLLIVDGLKVDNIQYLDPSMIENIEVLKDAASAAIYGAEAGNGVILITTKKGEAGHASISYDMKLVNQSIAHKAEIFNAKDFIAYKELSGIDMDTKLKVNNYDGTNTDWQDVIFDPSWSTQHSLTFQGGNRNGHFFASLNMLNNDGIVVGNKDQYKRLTAQINADYNLFILCGDCGTNKY
jgi:TonB-linked SusC/RagA family outer membrane protein